MAFILKCLASIHYTAVLISCKSFVCLLLSWRSQICRQFPRQQAGRGLGIILWLRTRQGHHRRDLVRGTTGKILSGGPQGRSSQGDNRGDLVRGTTGEILSGGPQGRSCQGDHRRDLVL